MDGKPEPTLEYCALHYLNQWLAYDRHYVAALRFGAPAQKQEKLKNALVFYKVARNFPKECDEGKGMQRYSPLLRILNTERSRKVGQNVINDIEVFEEKFATAYTSTKKGRVSCLSATTKLLWLHQRAISSGPGYESFGETVVIYDSKARSALGFRGADYEKYHETWYDTYEGFECCIKRACRELKDELIYSIEYGPNQKADVLPILGQSWFHERVFDIYLWFLGDRSFVLVDPALT